MKNNPFSHPPHNLSAHVADGIRTYLKGNFHLYVACSGGVDSMVLVRLLHQLSIPITVLHCNFNLRGEESKRDQQFVEALCKELNILCIVQSFDTKAELKSSGKGIQEVARKLRYDWFDRLLNQHPQSDQHVYLTTAHHADDQIEGISMNFFRGTGISGMKGMSILSNSIFRPFLGVSRATIVAHAETQKWKWVEDSSNQELYYTRNQFRNKIIPEVESIYTTAKANLWENAQRFSEVEELYRKEVNKRISKLLKKRDGGYVVDVNRLKAQTPLNTILFELFYPFGFHTAQLEELIKLFDAPTGKYMCSDTYRVLKNRNWFWIDSLQKTKDDIVVIEEGQTEAECNERTFHFGIHHGNQIKVHNSQHAQLDLNQLEFPLILRKWKEGDYFYPLGMRKKKKISRFLTDLKLSRTEKENQWVLESNKRIIWVVDKRIDDRFKITSSTQKTVLIK